MLVYNAEVERKEEHSQEYLLYLVSRNYKGRREGSWAPPVILNIQQYRPLFGFF
jgi:hypothetical protein